MISFGKGGDTNGGEQKDKDQHPGEL